MTIFLNPEYKDLDAIAKKNNTKYTSAEPFPHICLDNFFNQDFVKKVMILTNKNLLPEVGLLVSKYLFLIE